MLPPGQGEFRQPPVFFGKLDHRRITVGMLAIVDHSASFTQCVQYVHPGPFPDKDICPAETHFADVRSQRTQVIVRVTNGGHMRVFVKVAQLGGERFISQAEGMNHFGSVQFPHRFRVIRRIRADGMCRNCNAVLSVNFVYRAAGRLSPGYRVADTDREHVVSNRMDLLAGKNDGAARSRGKPLTHLRNPGVLMWSHGNGVEALPTGFHYSVPG